MISRQSACTYFHNASARHPSYEHPILDDILPSHYLLCVAVISMPFLYVYVCDLLEKLSQLVDRDCPLLVGLEKETNRRIVDWLRQHRGSLNESSVDDQAVMLMFTPEKRTDRDYGLDSVRLEQLIARVLNLPRVLHLELQMWRNGPAHGDLAACVERVMAKMTWVSRFSETHVTTTFRSSSFPKNHCLGLILTME